jgi:catechol 2,3-dioxygenase-like lactoylglutathione lyase family enzyme
MYSAANVTLMVADVNRAVEFYTRTLGLPLKQRFGDAWVEVQAPGVLIGLHPAGGMPIPAERTAAFTIGLMVDDLDATLAELGARGLAVDQRHDNPEASSAYFRDPDGNPLYLMQRHGMH